MKLLEQQYDEYTEEDFLVWKTLYDRQMELLPGLASPAFFEGTRAIEFESGRIPKFSEVNELLGNITGWNLVVVPGLIDNKPFFELLEAKKFPATTWFRKFEQLDYLQEPDMFHDVYGHVPLLSNHDFCGFLTGLSKIALRHIENPDVVELVSRIYWYTVEFGLIQEDEGLRIYGAGILSSPGESVYSLESDVPERVPYDPLEIAKTPYIKDRYQEKYFVINSYRDLYESVDDIEKAIEHELRSTYNFTKTF